MNLTEPLQSCCCCPVQRNLPVRLNWQDRLAVISKGRDYVRGGAEGALAPPEFEGSERRTEGETDNSLLIAPSESKF